MHEEPGLFEVMYTLRAMRRLKPDPVPLELVERLLDAGIRAPSGQNSQPWAFLVLTGTDDKRFFGERYDYWIKERFGAALLADDPRTAQGRTVNAARHLAEHMHEAPVILMVLGRRDWPFAVAPEARVGRAPPSYGSVYPCVQNILLAARALGLGASLTTMHQMFEDELHAHFGIPEDHGVVAVIPIGWPQGRFGPVRREPVADKTHYGRWGGARPRA
ncbi:MAG: nitroreductase family protein [Gammaproteobacteria bacterium]|nr:nitroreductase family protein [Gammaproteobacteria bacterium]